MQSGREKTNHSRPERSLSFPFSLNCFTFLLLFPSISFLLLTLSLFHCFYLRVFWGWGGGKVAGVVFLFFFFASCSFTALSVWSASFQSLPFYFSVLVFISFISAPPSKERDVITTFIKRKVCSLLFLAVW